MPTDGHSGLTTLPTNATGRNTGPRDRFRPAETRGVPDAHPGLSPSIAVGLVRLFELLFVATSGALITWFYIPSGIGVNAAYFIAIPGAGLLTVAAFEALDLYHPGRLRRFAANIVRVMGGFSLAFLFLFALIFFLKLEGVFSRVVFATWFITGLGLLIGGRFVASIILGWMTRQGWLERRAVIVGGGPQGTTLIQTLAHQPDSDIRICGVFDERMDPRSPDIVAGFPKLGNIDDLVDYARSTRIDLVIFALPVTAEKRILGMLRKLWVLPVDIRLAAHAQELHFRPRNYSYVGSVPMFDIADRPVADWGLVFKAIMDRALGLALLVAMLPLFAAIALAIKLDSRGPVFFRQKRYGFNNRMIEIFKFRTMYADRSDATAARLVTRDDPRVTRIGRFLRRASLDELPQLINVAIKGDLSLVGPRPHAVHAKAANRLYDEVVEGYFARHRVKPGMSGWAQVNGWRGETDTPEKIQKRVEHDLFYIENWSLVFDFYILARTPFALFKGENAY